MESISLLFKVLWAPGEAMFRAAKNAKAAWAPILLLTAAGIVSVSAMFTHLNIGEMQLRMMEQAGRAQQLTPEQRNRIMEVTNGPVAHTFGWTFGAIGPVLGIAVVSLIYFGLFTLVGKEGRFAQFFAVTAFAFVPLILRNIAGVLTVMVVPQSQIMLDEIGGIGPAVFLDRTAMSRKLFAAVTQLDVISIWVLVLLVIGYGFLLRKSVSTLTRTVCVFLVFGVYAAFRIAMA